MSGQLYSVTPHPVDTILTWVKSKEIAIPEVQRPFVWESSKVRDLLDSLYRGYPIGYLISWRNPNVKLKDGTTSIGKRVLIDGQQRVTALMASLLGLRVLNKNYDEIRITISFNPLEEKFEVANAATMNGSAWINDVSTLFSPEAKMLAITKNFVEANPGCDEDEVYSVLDKLLKISNNHVGLIELSEDLDIETVTEIFIRVNSQGVALSQADFAMSKIAVNETYGGNMLRKAIDYFCHLSVVPDFIEHIREKDKGFKDSEFMSKMSWVADFNDDLYDPTYTDMLRVAYTSEMGRGEMKNLVALLSGRNFETRQYEEEIAEKSFAQLKTGILNFMNETNYKRFVMILKSAGFVSSDLIGGQNAVNFAYIVYLRAKQDGVKAAEIETLVRQWFVMSVLTGRYSGTPETRYDQDIRQIRDQGLANYVKLITSTSLSDAYWENLLPQQMDTSAARSPYWLVFQAALAADGEKGFLSSDILARDLIEIRGDVHHLYPKKYLKDQNLGRGLYNQIANFAITQSEINIAIGAKAPAEYFRHLAEQTSGGERRYGNITDQVALRANLVSQAIPVEILDGELPYQDFLELRRKLMAKKIKSYYNKLSGLTVNTE